MAKPLIALSPQYDLTAKVIRMMPDYLRALADAGGLPVVLPLEADQADIQRFAELFDGLLLTGGPDVSPFTYGEDAHVDCGPVCRLRDELEFALIPAFLKAGKPIFGVCRGLQILNVALGGDLYQDITSLANTAQQHRQTSPETDPIHTVTVTEESLLHRITGRTSLHVNSLHHQAVRTPAQGFEVCARAGDGLIEAQYLPDRPFVLGVQWHPEMLRKEDPAARMLFQAFVKACEDAKQ